MQVNLEVLQNIPKSMNAEGILPEPGQLEDTYWSGMKLFGIPKPKMEKVKEVVEAEQTEETTKKKKGFLPETKKHKNRKKPTVQEGKETPASTETPEGVSGDEGKKKNKKKNKTRKQQGGEETQDQPASKKTKTQPQQKKKSRCHRSTMSALHFPAPSLISHLYALPNHQHLHLICTSLSLHIKAHTSHQSWSDLVHRYMDYILFLQ